MEINGFTKELIEQMSVEKSEPVWMKDLRLGAFRLSKELELPHWGPDISALDLSEITYYISSNQAEADAWEDVPESLRKEYDLLGVREAEQRYLGGSGAQFDSQVVYHRLKDHLEKKGVIFESLDTAVSKYPDLVQQYFSTVIAPDEHFFISLHYSVWSGGTFIYVPKGVVVDMPLQAYFRIGTPGAGQFEHTLIIVDEGATLTYIEGCSAPKYAKNSLHAGGVEIVVGKNARVNYVSIENWSDNTFNLNTKKALVHEGGYINWINGNLGAGVTMLYPTSVLLGDNSKSESLGLSFARRGQVQDTGTKVIHIGQNTKSVTRSKSISKGGGVSTYRGYIEIGRDADSARASVSCDALILDTESKAKAYPFNRVAHSSAELSHEATTTQVNQEVLFLLGSLGIDKATAMRMVVGGFTSEVLKALPFEYAIEFNKLLDIEMDTL
jgi:Fe-S cluster assembly protein SufB